MATLKQSPAQQIAAPATTVRPWSAVAMALTVLSIGGLVLAALLRNARPSDRNHLSRSARLRWLRRAVIGADEQKILGLLGSPRALATSGTHAATWYYPMHSPRQALAIQLEDGIAHGTRVVAPPQRRRPRRR